MSRREGNRLKCQSCAVSFQVRPPSAGEDKHRCPQCGLPFSAGETARGYVACSVKPEDTNRGRLYEEVA